ncbi:uncharacterized protein LOC133737798 [Rosa rugosa]|uniref:uncharacterized protein LOC133737798 n=1 Tax=Rosa rugosa TaxID=74645 RepID=UPI002B4070AF|nr:uncharacterized protein LOC133737798 [Rosa rugosa]
MESSVWPRAAGYRSQNDEHRAHNFSKHETSCDSVVKKGPKARIGIWDPGQVGVTVTLPQLLNLANLRARSSFRPDGARSFDGDDDRHLRSWRRKLLSSLTAVKLKLTWTSAFRFALLLFLLAAIATACISLPIEKSLKDFLLWIKQDLGPWGPLVLAVAYIPLTVLAVPASVLTLGGGYLFGLPVGFIADSIGATLGATAAFILGRTIGRSYVISKLKHYPKFQAVAVAIQRSGFKIVLLLRLAPLLPFNMLNYLLSVTPVHIGDYMLATWLGMMPITFALVYVGTTLKDLSDVTHGWNEVSTTRWVFIVLGFGISVILLICISKVAKASLEKALADNAEIEGIFSSSTLPIVAGMNYIKE